MAKKTILIVDDEADFLEVMRQRVLTWGYDVVVAQSGEIALDMLQKEKIDIIILDYMMPGLDGIATLKAIRKVNKNIPVVMFTAHPDERAIVGTEKMGVSFFIPKLSVYSDVQASLRSALAILENSLSRTNDAQA